MLWNPPSHQDAFVPPGQLPGLLFLSPELRLMEENPPPPELIHHLHNLTFLQTQKLTPGQPVTLTLIPNSLGHHIVMIDLVDRQPDHHRCWTAGKLHRLSDVIDLILSELPVDIVDRKEWIGEVPYGLR